MIYLIPDAGRMIPIEFKGKFSGNSILLLNVVLAKPTRLIIMSCVGRQKQNFALSAQDQKGIIKRTLFIVLRKVTYLEDSTLLTENKDRRSNI